MLRFFKVNMNWFNKDSQEYLKEQISLWESYALEGEKELSELVEEKSDLENRLKAIENEYNIKVSPLILELEKIEIQIREFQRRLDLLNKTNEDLNKIEDSIKNDFEEEWRSWSDHHEEIEESKKADNETLLTEEYLAELKKLYKTLARMFHPDKATDPTQKELFHSIMVQINTAYSNNDLETLKEIFYTYGDEFNEKETSYFKILEKKLFLFERVKAKYLRIRKELEEIKMSSIYDLFSRLVSSGLKLDEFLQGMINRIEQDISEKKKALDQLEVKWKSSIS